MGHPNMCLRTGLEDMQSAEHRVIHKILLETLFILVQFHVDKEDSREDYK